MGIRANTYDAVNGHGEYGIDVIKTTEDADGYQHHDFSWFPFPDRTAPFEDPREFVEALSVLGFTPDDDVETSVDCGEAGMGMSVKVIRRSE